MSLKQRVVDIINRKEMNAEILIFLELNKFLDFPGGLAVKYLPAVHEMLEAQVWSLGWEDPLEQEMATTPVLVPEESHGQRSPAGYGPWGRKELDMTEQPNSTKENIQLH